MIGEYLSLKFSGGFIPAGWVRHILKLRHCQWLQGVEHEK